MSVVNPSILKQNIEEFNETKTFINNKKDVTIKGAFYWLKRSL